MSNRVVKPGDRIAFRAPHEALGALDSSGVALLAGSIGDIALVLDAEARVVDISFAGGDPTGVGADGWIGQTWGELVTVESRQKLVEMMAAARTHEVPRWRQVNHLSSNGDVPIRYIAVATGTNGHVLAIGQDQRAASVLQQKLIQAQQSMERDYLKLRQTEARYRLLFDLDSDAVIVVDAETRRIREANPAANKLTRAKPGALVGKPLTSLFDVATQEPLLAYLGSVVAADGAEPVLGSLEGEHQVQISATPFRQDRAAYFLVRVRVPAERTTAMIEVERLRHLIDQLPDAFVLVDARARILSVNASFLDLSQEVSVSRLKGAPLSDYVGRAGIDVDLIIDQLREHGVLRNVTTIVRGKDGAVEEVEVSAVAMPDADGDGYGFSLRNIGRRATDAPAAERDVPRSVEQLTELVGRMSLKDMVRESTDLIERLCIEAALEYTSDNRASAAEILGVSRQSLYSKLHRHGLGNLVSGDE